MRFPQLKFQLVVGWLLAWKFMCGMAFGQEASFPWLDPQTNSPVFVEPDTVGTDGSASRKIVP